ncbi:hypothetical protein HanXRQr2_Chr13g0566471 [Helianthus annuus]|uniref:Uncharacterized protein n=1 Tax=Helianthus annuus TaxID=4232 RepID=A0A9K3HA56_HELAN|nr:hypothetical protein HanXRQr2_Chr13g0566471 [Helianthus annuus]KAJ0847450.1 hypothetical protein HanPSC8_Chr13g0545481 [Helianthus annuus]
MHQLSFQNTFSIPPLPLLYYDCSTSKPYTSSSSLHYDCRLARLLAARLLAGARSHRWSCIP